jgi:CRISPR-associated protein Cmr3
MAVPTYLLDPKALLLFRDGRPFGATERAETLLFPLPSTTAGALRTAYGEAQRTDYVTGSPSLRQLAVAGSLLAKRDARTGALEVLFPKPDDVLYLPHEGTNKTLAHRLAPASLRAGEGCDLPHDKLLPVFLQCESKAKPAEGPAFWRLETLTEWLADDSITGLDTAEIGAPHLPVGYRIHVAMDYDAQANREGQLFQAAGLDFGARRRLEDHGWEHHEYALLLKCDADFPSTFRTVGGERRLAWLERCDGYWPPLPERLRKALEHAPGLRLILATPAIFNKEGYLPDWLNKNLEGSPPGLPELHLRLCAVALKRWQAASGWDLQARDKRPEGAARAARRLVPVGAVYWFQIVQGQASAAAQLWLHSICQGEQDRSDGFGLTLPGVWSHSN